MNGKAMTYTYMCIKRHVKNRSPVHAVLQRAKQLDRTTIAATDKNGNVDPPRSPWILDNVGDICVVLSRGEM